MNCKPGDMVIVTRDKVGMCSHCGLPGILNCAGKIGRVTRLVQGMDECWLFEEAIPAKAFNLCGTESLLLLGMEDSHLKPLRDSDGPDETLQWIPTPTKETT